MLIKLDMKNAFDCVKLPFLYEVLLSFGFSYEFVNSIKSCTDRPTIYKRYKYHHVSKKFRMKYLKGGSLRNITSSNTPLGTTRYNYLEFL